MTFISSIMKNLLLATAFLIMAPCCYAQETTEGELVKKQSGGEHLIGVQLNELIRQVSLNDATETAVQNPYLITYMYNSLKDNWGVRIGLGLQTGTSAPGNFFGVDTLSKVFNLNLRFGFMKSIRLADKLVCGLGGDLVFYHVDRTTSENASFGFGGDRKLNIDGYGGGPVASVRYEFTRHISVGTETSFYYTFGTQKVSDGSFTSHDEKISNGSFNLPIALYFIIKI